MSTHRIPRLEELDEMQRSIDELMANAVRERDDELQAEADRLAGQRARMQREYEAAEANAQLARRLRAQVHADRNDGLNGQEADIREERGQLGFILNGTPSSVFDQDVDDEAPAPPPAPNPEPAPVTAAVPDDNVVVRLAPEPTVVVPASPYHPRNWTWLAWIGAVIGLLVAWSITGANWHRPLFYDDEGARMFVASLLIWTGGLGLGFGIGGLIGQFFATRRMRCERARNNAVQPAQAVVVTPAQRRQVPPPPPRAA